MTFGQWFATSPVASILRTFAAVMLSLAVADWATAGALSLTNWQTWVIGALASSLPTILRALNPADGAYGRTGDTPEK